VLCHNDNTVLWQSTPKKHMAAMECAAPKLMERKSPSSWRHGITRKKH
jgi:hypothetical protein